MRPMLRAGAIFLGVLGAATAFLRLLSAPKRGSGAQGELERAVAAIDRELAANLELTTMFDQTKQAFVLENGQFLGHRSVLERELRALYPAIAGLYERMIEAESAMERRGPVGSIRDADRAIVESWEGDAREAQRALRAAVAAPPLSRWERLTSRLRARSSR